MLNPEQIDGLGIAFQRLTDPVTEFLIKDIARRVQKAGKLTSTAEYQLYRLQVLGVELPKVQKQLEELLGVAADEAAELLEQAGEFGYLSDAERLGSDVKFSEAAGIRQIIEASKNLARGDLTNITQTIGFVNRDGVARDLTAAYEKAMDEAFTQTVTGSTDYNTAIRRACTKLNSDGIQSINYASNVNTSLEAAVRRNLMGGTGLMVEQISQKNFQDMGADGWEISAHSNCAPDHEPIQGKQYTDEEFQRINSRLKRRIGTLNCGHVASPIKLGVSKPQYSSTELKKFRTDNQKTVFYEGREFKSMYEAIQKGQRPLEVAIRTQKRRVLTATPDDEAAAKSRLNVLRSEYKRFSKAVGLRTEDERLFVAGFGRKK